MTKSVPLPVPCVLVRWLLIVALLVFLMVVVGGITRLTESGLSITEWKPITGVIPPLNHQDWQLEYRKYQQITEYKEIGKPSGMTLSDFKFIYFWEWVHRLLGRLVGVVFAIPLVWFWVSKRIPDGFKLRLMILFFLGAIQGVAGWWMVSSGLADRTDVSHYRLAIHLLLALAIFAGLIWTALDLHTFARTRARPARLTGFCVVVFSILFIELLLGAFTAGLNAGYVSNTWPLMYGHFFPPGFECSLETLLSIPNNPVLIHFLHRWWAWLVVLVLTLLARRVRKEHRKASIVLHCAFGTQIVLGIATVMTTVSLPLAVMHQAGGALVVVATVWCAHLIGRIPASGVKS